MVPMYFESHVEVMTKLLMKIISISIFVCFVCLFTWFNQIFGADILTPYVPFSFG